MRQGACVPVAKLDFSSAGAVARDRKRAFRQELAFYEQQTGDAFICCSPAGAVAAWNPAAERIYGYSPREAIGRALSFLTPPSRVDQMALTLERVREGTSIAGYEVTQKRKDGSPIQVVLSLCPVYDARGKVVEISMVGRDVSGLRRCQDVARSALEQYHQLLEDVPCGILYMEPLGKVLYANRALARMLCYPSMRDLHQIDAKTRLFPDARAFAEFIAQETPFGQRSGIQMRWYRADRTSIPVRLSSRIITNDSKDLIAYEVFVEDFSS